jgi:hypothetical protein
MQLDLPNLTNKLTEGQTFPNYPTFCTTLKLPILTGGAKIRFFSILSYYLRIEKTGHKITIVEIFKEPIPLPTRVITYLNHDESLFKIKKNRN